MSMLQELKRRNVFRVGAAYLAGSWLLIQLMSNVFPFFGFAADAGRPVVVILAVGFVPALVLAWVFQVTPKGVRVDTGAGVGATGADTTRRFDRGIIVLLVIAVALFAVDRFVLGPVRDAELVAATAERVAADLKTGSGGDKSVAVLPFLDLSETGDQAWLADGLTEQIIDSLWQLPELLVTARTSSFQFRGDNLDIREIADKLGVANVVEGSVRRSGERLRITAQLIRARDGFHLWSQDYDSMSEDVLDVQRDVAEQIASALDILLDDERRAAMLRSGTRNVEAFEYAQRGWAVYWAVHNGAADQTLWDANVLFERALAIDSDYASAAFGATDAYIHLLTDGPRGMAANAPYSDDEALSRLLDIADRAIAGSPNEATRVIAALTRELLSSTWYRMPALIEQLRTTWDLGSVDVELMGYVWPILLFTGNYDLMREMAQRYLIVDPLMATSWITLITVELQTGNLETATELIRKARRSIGDHPVFQNLEFQARWMAEVAVGGSGSGEREATIAQLEGFPNSANNPLLAALKGESERALQLAEGITSANPRPELGLLPVYCLAGDYDAASKLVRRVDALPVGPANLLMFAAQRKNSVFNDLSAMPNFVRQLSQAGIDPAAYPEFCAPSGPN